jgi:quercetin dioxygenase-like cupin family protein
MPASSILRLDELPEREQFPGYHGRFIHSDSMTLVYWTVDAGAAFPDHTHPHEQVLNMLDGELDLLLDGRLLRLCAGDVVVIPPNARHSGRATTPCRILDVFSPVREDYR